MEAETAENIDLARNFGFDITMSGGNMGMPAAAHKDYMMRCNFLYKEFLSKMNLLIKEEQDVKKTLQELYKEKIKNLRFSMYRSEDGHDPFARKQEPTPVSPISPMWESRGTTPWGLDPIADEEENPVRPQTAPAKPFMGMRPDEEVFDVRPKTAGAEKTDIHDDAMSGKGMSDVTQVSEIVGVLDPKSERTSCRKITVSKHSFAKVSVREANIKIKDREGKFHVKPIKDAFAREQSENVAYDPSQAYKQYDPVNERLALVRQVTNYKAPTIASDMKINNRVPIQKSLRGEDAKRVTVAEIYRNARDRRTRRFKLIIKKSAKENSEEENAQKLENRNLLSVNSIPFSKDEMRTHSRQTHTRTSFCENTPAEISQTPPPISDLSTSANGGLLRAILKGSVGEDNDESQMGRDSRQENGGKNGSSRPASLGVAFARRNSVYSDIDSHYDGNNDINAGRTRRGSILKLNRTPQLGVTPKATETSADLGIGTARDHAARLGKRLSIVSVASAGSFLVKLKNAINSKSDEGSEAKLSFRPPTKVETMSDSAKIVKQQMRKDRQLDERMAIWKRRMVHAGISTGRGSMGPKKRGGRLRMI